MRRFILVLLLLIPFVNWGQINPPYTNGFEGATPLTDWTQVTGTFNVTSDSPCSGNNSIRTKLTGVGNFGTAILTKKTKVGDNDGGIITFSFDYKWLFDNGNILGNPVAAPANSLDLRWQWSNSANGPWYTFETIDANNHTPSTSCTTITSTFAAYEGPLFVRLVVSNLDASGDNFLYIDNIDISESTTIIPTCKLPQNPRVASKTKDSMVVNWDKPLNQSPASYDWEIRTSGKPGSGTAGLVVSDNVTTTTTGTVGPPTVTLLPSTSYKIYVRARCSSTDIGEWIGIETVTFCDWPTFNPNTNYSICGIQEVELTAPGGGTNFWFDEDYNLVGQGNPFTTPEITESTHYYVFSGITNSTSNSTITLGAGIGTNTSNVPFSNVKGVKTQYIYQASELKAAGFTRGVIKAFGFKTGTTGGTLQRNNFTIHMGLTSYEEFAKTNFIPTTDLQLVKNAGNQLLVADQVNMFNLDESFAWDGESNIVVQFTYSDTATSLSSTSTISSVHSGSNRALYTDSSTLNLTGLNNVATGTLSDIRINGYFDILDGCFAPMKKIEIDFNPAPTLNLSQSTVTNCMGSPLTKLYVLTGVGDYDTYEWGPNDPNDPTNPDNADNAITGDENVGWTFNPASNNITYTLTASHSGSGCIIKKEITIINRPSPQMLQLQNNYDLCTGDVVELKVDNNVKDEITKYLFNGNTSGVTLNNAVAGDAITNETSLFSEGTGSLKLAYSSQTSATLNFPGVINMLNLKSIIVEFDHIAALQSTSIGVMDYGYLEYSTDNGGTWKPFLAADYVGAADTTLTQPSGTTAMFFTKQSYADWSGIQQTTVPSNTAWKSEKFVVPSADFTGTGTFKVRFRIGADGNVQFPGWYIDNIRITPVNNHMVTWSPIANLYYDQNATVPYDGTVNSGTLYLKGITASPIINYKVDIENQFGCKVEKNFSVKIGLNELPVVHDINSCGPVNTANTNFGKNPNGVLTYYNSPTSSTTITQITTSGIYYVDQSIAACRSVRVPFTVIINPAAPLAVAAPSQSFCGSAVVSDIVFNAVQGFQMKWYLTLTGGTALANTTPINNGTYYGEFTNGSCTSASRVAVNVTVGVTPASITLSNVSICGTSTIADVNVNAASGATVNWYQNIGDTTPLANTTVLATGTYYIAQQIGTCESSRTPVSVSTISNLTMPTANTVQTFCANGTVGQLMATATTAGATVNWYSFITSDVPLVNTTPLVTGTYYVGQSIGDCDSPRRAVSVRILSVNAPVINPISICGDATVSSLPLNPSQGSNYKVYDSAFATTEMGQNDVINTAIYYISKVENGCETARTAVSVTVNARPNAPTGNINQSFPDYAEVKDLKTNEANVVWFESYNDAVNNANPLYPSTPLVKGKTYYGVIIGTGNCPSLPLAVTVDIFLGLNDLDLASLKYYPNPTDSELTISYKEAIKSIEVYDVTGKQVKTQQFDSNEVRINVSTLAAGTYMVKVHTNTGSQFIKVVKK